MEIDPLSARLSRRVAEAADALLTDPLDVAIYGRFVDATLAWRAYVQPMLAGTEHAGRRDPLLEGRAHDESAQEREPARAPAALGELMRGSPQELVAHLTGRQTAGEDQEGSPLPE